MAATPFKVTVDTVQDNGQAGPTFNGSASDVAGEFVSWDDIPGTPDYLQLPAGLRLADISVSAAGVDTKRMVLTRGTATTTHVLRDARLVETLALDGRQRLGVLFDARLQAGVQYGLKQVA